MVAIKKRKKNTLSEKLNEPAADVYAAVEYKRLIELTEVNCSMFERVLFQTIIKFRAAQTDQERVSFRLFGKILNNEFTNEVKKLNSIYNQEINADRTKHILLRLEELKERVNEEIINTNAKETTAEI